MNFLFLPCNCTLVSLFYFVFYFYFYLFCFGFLTILQEIASGVHHHIRCFLSFSLVLSFQDLSLILTYICLNIEDNVNFKLGGVLIVCLIV
jgi:hypothetical protein